VVEGASQPLIEALAMVAPGRPLREGLDRILQAKRGALVVVGDDPAVLSICTGGFLLDAEFSPQRLSELAKMDGAIILAADASRIARANVHLMPKASIPTTETGTRHRTAERVARSIEVPVLTVSEAMSTIAVFRNDAKHTIPDTGWLVDRATQAISTLQRFKSRFDLGLVVLSTLEVEDTVSVRDVVAVLQPGEMVARIAAEIEGYLVELGEDGRLIGLQLEELEQGSQESLRLVVADYVAFDEGSGPGRHRGTDRVERERRVARVLAALRALSTDELLDGSKVGAFLGLDTGLLGLDTGVEARGYRLLHRLPRVSEAVIEAIVERFASLPRIMQASPADLEKAGGIGGSKARSLKESLGRLVEATILERYE
jgi:diadenylate cyclase